MNIKKTINDLSEREDKKLNCEYDFLDEQQVLDQKLSFIETIHSRLIIAYAANCLFFAFSSLFQLLGDTEMTFPELLLENVFTMVPVFVLGWLSCKRHSTLLPILATVIALFSAVNYDNFAHGVMMILSYIFCSKIAFFAVTLVISCICIAANIKFRGLNDQKISGVLELNNSRRDFQDHMDKMDRTRKYFREEEKLNSGDIHTKRTAGSSDLGSTRGTPQNYMDDI